MKLEDARQVIEQHEKGSPGLDLGSLREYRGQMTDASRATITRSEAEGRDMTEEERKAFDEFMAIVKRFDDHIKAPAPSS